MRKFIIERDLPDVGRMEREQLRGAAAKSNEARAQLAPHVQWVESYVADDKTFCVYLARDEDVSAGTRSSAVFQPAGSPRSGA